MYRGALIFVLIAKACDDDCSTRTGKQLTDCLRDIEEYLKIDTELEEELFDYILHCLRCAGQTHPRTCQMLIHKRGETPIQKERSWTSMLLEMVSNLRRKTPRPGRRALILVCVAATLCMHIVGRNAVMNSEVEVRLRKIANNRDFDAIFRQRAQLLMWPDDIQKWIKQIKKNKSWISVENIYLSKNLKLTEDDRMLLSQGAPEWMPYLEFWLRFLDVKRIEYLLQVGKGANVLFYPRDFVHKLAKMERQDVQRAVTSFTWLPAFMGSQISFLRDNENKRKAETIQNAAVFFGALPLNLEAMGGQMNHMLEKLSKPVPSQETLLKLKFAYFKICVVQKDEKLLKESSLFRSLFATADSNPEFEIKPPEIVKPVGGQTRVSEKPTNTPHDLQGLLGYVIRQVQKKVESVNVSFIREQKFPWEAMARGDEDEHPPLTGFNSTMLTEKMFETLAQSKRLDVVHLGLEWASIQEHIGVMVDFTNGALSKNTARLVALFEIAMMQASYYELDESNDNDCMLWVSFNGFSEKEKKFLFHAEGNGDPQETLVLERIFSSSIEIQAAMRPFLTTAVPTNFRRVPKKQVLNKQWVIRYINDFERSQDGENYILKAEERAQIADVHGWTTECVLSMQNEKTGATTFLMDTEQFKRQQQADFIEQIWPAVKNMFVEGVSYNVGVAWHGLIVIGHDYIWCILKECILAFMGYTAGQAIGVTVDNALKAMALFGGGTGGLIVCKSLNLVGTLSGIAGLSSLYYSYRETNLIIENMKTHDFALICEWFLLLAQIACFGLKRWQRVAFTDAEAHDRRYRAIIDRLKQNEKALRGNMYQIGEILNEAANAAKTSVTSSPNATSKFIAKCHQIALQQTRLLLQVSMDADKALVAASLNCQLKAIQECAALYGNPSKQNGPQDERSNLMEFVFMIETDCGELKAKQRGGFKELKLDNYFKHSNQLLELTGAEFRMHDHGYSKWTQLIQLVLIMGIRQQIVVSFQYAWYSYHEDSRRAQAAARLFPLLPLHAAHNLHSVPIEYVCCTIAVFLCQMGILYLNVYDCLAKPEAESQSHSVLQRAPPRAMRRISFGGESPLMLEAPASLLRDLEMQQKALDILQIQNKVDSGHFRTNTNIVQSVLAYASKILSSMKACTHESRSTTHHEHADLRAGASASSSRGDGDGAGSGERTSSTPTDSGSSDESTGDDSDSGSDAPSRKPTKDIIMKLLCLRPEASVEQVNGKLEEILTSLKSDRTEKISHVLLALVKIFEWTSTDHNCNGTSLDLCIQILTERVFNTFAKLDIGHVHTCLTHIQTLKARCAKTDIFEQKIKALERALAQRLEQGSTCLFLKDSSQCVKTLEQLMQGV